MATNEIKTPYKFPNKANSTLEDFLDIAVNRAGLGKRSQETFIKLLKEWAVSQEVTPEQSRQFSAIGEVKEGLGRKNVNDILKSTAYDFFSGGNFEEFSDYVFEKYDSEISKVNKVNAKGEKVLSGLGSSLTKLVTVANEYNKNVGGPNTIPSKVISSLVDRHTTSKDVKRILGVQQVMGERGRSPLEIMDFIMERIDARTNRLMSEIIQLKDLGNVGRTSQESAELAKKYTELAKIEAGKDLMFTLLGTGTRISETLALEAYDHSKNVGNPENSQKAIMLVSHEFEQRGVGIERGTGKIKNSHYALNFPPKVTKEDKLQTEIDKQDKFPTKSNKTGQASNRSRQTR